MFQAAFRIFYWLPALSGGFFIIMQPMKTSEPIVLVVFNKKSARYLVLFVGKSTR
jgi:hypothetical protein